MSIDAAALCAYGSALSELHTEVEWRNAVGRSYYAAYLTADAWHEALSTHGMAEAGQGVHATLISCLINPTVSGAKMIRSKSVGYMLQAMKTSRKKADYDLHLDVDQAEASTVAAQAVLVLAKTATA
jgi:uncharacterized protein (UPF0332 family)